MLHQEIRKARIAAGLTQEQVAYVAGVSREYLNQLEAGKHSPTVEVLFRLCRALNMPVSDLIRTVEQSELAKPSGVADQAKESPTSHPQKVLKPTPDERFAPALQRLLGDLFHRWRRESGMDRRSIAGKLGLRREDVLSAERGERSVTFLEFVKWCEVCKKNPGAAIKQAIEAMGKKAG